MFGLTFSHDESKSNAVYETDQFEIPEEYDMSDMFSSQEFDLWQRIQGELKSRKERLSQKKKQFEREWSKPTFIRKKDKYAFTVGVILTVSTTLIASRYPFLLPYFYLFWCANLLITRFFMYHKQNYHYFMLDFCYLANILLLFYLFMYPTSPHLYLLNFANANGPLLWAIVTWRNSLVFHDVDKITSVFIHSFPPIVTYVLRVYPESHKYQRFETCLNDSCTASFSTIVVTHLVFYLFWQICYYVKTEVIDRDRMSKNQHIVTSFRWMKQDTHSAAYKIINRYGERYQVFIYMAMQFTFHLLTVLPVKIMYDYPWVHSLVMCYVFFTCVHNGSNYYIEKFSKSYLERLQQIATSLEEKHESAEDTQKKEAVAVC